MYDLTTLEAIVAARKHLRDKWELSSFEETRILGIEIGNDFYRIRGYVEEQQLFFDLHPYDNGTVHEAVAKRIPLIPQIACVSDHYRDVLVRCRNISGNHDWTLEFTKALEVVTSEYELLPGSQPNTEDGLVYLANENGEVLSVEGKFLTIFQPEANVEHRMIMESSLAKFQQHLMNAKPETISNEFLQSAFMVEKALNSGHIDMLEIDLRLVLEGAVEQLSRIGETRHAEELAGIVSTLPKDVEDTPDFLKM